MGTELELMRLQNHAKRDKAVRDLILATRTAPDPYKAFCTVAQSLGYDISLFELVDIGQAFCDTMLRSVNSGGTESFDEWTDFYEMFFAAIK